MRSGIMFQCFLLYQIYIVEFTEELYDEFRGYFTASDEPGISYNIIHFIYFTIYIYEHFIYYTRCTHDTNI